MSVLNIFAGAIKRNNHQHKETVISVHTDSILEYVAAYPGPAKIDRAAGIIHDVKILGLESRNRRLYPESTLAEAIPLYENAKVNINHPESHPAESRKYQDRFGLIKNVRLQRGEGLFGDFHFNPKHALAEQLLWDAENSPENVGFSHNVEAVVGTENGRVVVEKIEAVRSVDLVADPATTVGLFEQAEPDAGQKNATAENITPLKNNTPAEKRGKNCSDSVSGQIETAKSEAALDEAFRPFENRIALFEELLEAVVSAAVPSAARPVCWSRDFLRLALETESPEKLKMMIAERLELVRRLTGALTEAIPAGPILAAEKRAGGAADETISTEEFLRQIRE